MLEARTNLFKLQMVQVVEVEHAVRVPHRDARDLIGFAIHL